MNKIWWTCLLVVLVTPIIASASEETLRAGIGRVTAASDPAALIAETQRAAAKMNDVKDKVPREMLLMELWSRAGRRLASLAETAKDGAACREQSGKWLEQSLQLSQSLLDALDDQLCEITNKLPETANPESSPRWRAVAIRRYHTMYCDAWTRLGLAQLLSDDAQRKEMLRSAYDGFETFTMGGYSENPYVMDAFLGQALTLQKLGEPAKVIELLRQVKGNMPASFRQQFAFLCVRSYLDLGSVTQADVAAEEYFKSRGGGPLTALEATIRFEQLKCLVALSKSPGKYVAQYQTRRDKIAEDLNSLGLSWAKQVAEATGKTFIDPKEQLQAIQQRFSQKEYALVVQDCSFFLDDPKAHAQTRSMALYIRGCAYWNMKQYAHAFHDGQSLLRQYPTYDRAAEVLDRTLTAGQLSMRSTQTGHITAAEFESFCRDMLSRYGSGAQGLKLYEAMAQSLLQRKDYVKSEAMLRRAVSAGGGFLVHYQLVICVYKQWEELAGNTDEGNFKTVDSLLARQRSCLLGLLRFSQGKTLTKSQQHCYDVACSIAICVVQQYLAMKNQKAAADWMAELQGFTGFSQKSPGWIQLEITSLLDRGKPDEVLPLVRQLMRITPDESAGSTAQVLAAVLAPVNEYRDQLRKNGKGPNAIALTRDLLRIYELLLDVVGKDENSPLRSKEYAIRYNYAEELMSLEQYARAAKQYEWLRDNTEKGKSGAILEKLGTCYQKEHLYGKAIEVWRILTKGLEAKSDAWYRAWYELLCSYRLNGQGGHARKLLDFFLLKYPEAIKGDWAEKFRTLQTELHAEVPSPAK